MRIWTRLTAIILAVALVATTFVPVEFRFTDGNLLSISMRQVGADSDPWLGDWAYRVKLTTNSSLIDSDLSHFPLTAFLNADNGDTTKVFDEVAGNYSKIAIADSDRTQYYIEVESWSLAGRENWLSDWAYRKKITLDRTKFDNTDQTHFPVTVILNDDNDFFGQMGNGDSLKVAFTKNDGTSPLYAELEQYDSANDKATYHVSKSDWTITNTGAANDYFYLYYDSAQADNDTYIGVTGSTPAKNVWDTSFKFRSDMKDKTTATVEDSTSNANHGAKTAANEPIQADGKVGKAQDYTATNDTVVITDHSSIQNIFDGGGTVEFLVRADSMGSGNNYGRFYHKGGTLIYLDDLSGSNCRFLFQHGFSTTVGLWGTNGRLFVIGDWLHVAVTYNSDATTNNAILYINGAVVANLRESTPAGTRTSDAGNDLALGNRIALERAWDGLRDETRWSDTIRTASWLKGTHNSLANTLLSYESEEAFGGHERWAVLHFGKPGETLLSAAAKDYYLYYDSSQADNTQYVKVAGKQPGVWAGLGDYDHAVSFGWVTDVHYADLADSGRTYYRATLDKMEAAVAHWNSLGVDFAIQTGDFTDERDTQQQAIDGFNAINDVYQQSVAPARHVFGNHDFGNFDLAEYEALTGTSGNYSFEVDAFLFIVLDGCYNSDDDDDHYEDGNYDWDVAYVPPNQRSWLTSTLAASNKKKIIFIHQNIYTTYSTPSYELTNAAAVRTILENDGDVIAVFQGHFHYQRQETLNGITYYTGAAMAWDVPNNYHVVQIYSNNTIKVTGFGTQEAYGGSNAITLQKESHIGVWHGIDKDSSNIVDSGPNLYTGAKKGVNTPNEVDGQVGKAQDFASGDYVSMGDDVLDIRLYNLTIEGLFKTSVKNGTLATKHERFPTSNKGYMVYITSSGYIRSLIATGVGGAGEQYVTTGSADLADGAYHTFLASFNRAGNMTLYVDGMSIGTTDISSLAARDIIADGNFKLGDIDAALYPLTGDLDLIKVRMSLITNEAAWAKAMHHSLNDSLLTYGSEESYTVEITSTPDSFNFGTLLVNTTGLTGLDYFTITNTGGVAVDVTIQGTDLTGGDDTWTLNDEATPGENTCGLKAGLEGGDYTVIVKKSATYNTLKTNLAAEATQKWGLKIWMPTSVTNYDAQQMTGTVTLVASAAS